jgi:lipopolysaccharide transport system permease protein
MGAGARVREVWRYRRLLVYFSRQILLDEVRQSPLSWLWLILRSGAPIVVTAFVFGEIGRFDSGEVPYLLFLIVGMAAWNLFEFSLLAATRSMSQHSRLLTRVYFPRLILPAASTVEGVLRFGILAVFVIVVLLYYLVTQGRWYLQARPEVLIGLATLLLAWLFAVALGLWTAALDAPARDVRYSVRYFLRFWFFLTPVLYPLSLVPERWKWLLWLNPMTGIVETFRWSLLGVGELSLPSLAASMGLTVIVGIGGLLFFGRAEASLLDSL